MRIVHHHHPFRSLTFSFYSHCTPSPLSLSPHLTGHTLALKACLRLQRGPCEEAVQIYLLI